jgi:hypothetical protein
VVLSVTRKTAAFGLVFATCGLLVACSRRETIQVYTIPEQPDAGPVVSPALSTASRRLVYDTPAGWEPGAAGRMRRAAFVVRDGDAQVEITVIDLPHYAGTKLANINRWRQQLGLEPTGEDRLAAETEAFDFAGSRGTFVELFSPETSAQREAILGVMALVGDRSWFVKLKGDAALAARERERFQAFVRSIRFSGGEEGES